MVNPYQGPPSGAALSHAKVNQVAEMQDIISAAERSERQGPGSGTFSVPWRLR